MKNLNLILSILLALILSACGGGSGGGSAIVDSDGWTQLVSTECRKVNDYNHYATVAREDEYMYNLGLGRIFVVLFASQAACLNWDGTENDPDFITANPGPTVIYQYTFTDELLLDNSRVAFDNIRYVRMGDN